MHRTGVFAGGYAALRDVSHALGKGGITPIQRLAIAA
jgi:hypothetical protein